MIERVNELVDQFNMSEHPEGGFYKETFRSSHLQQDRSVLSSIYYLLFENHVSNLHTIDADEAWYHHEGGILEIHTFHPIKGYELLKLGSVNTNENVHPFHIVEAGTVFGSCLANLNDYALVSCAVAPAFLFEKFQLNSRSEMLSDFPDQTTIIHKLTR